jgi:hypothetical protein
VQRLRSLLNEDGKNIDDQAEEARLKVWRTHKPDAIRVRQGLVVQARTSESPLRVVSASKSAAVQLLLLSIFENQCRPPTRVGKPTTLPLTNPTEEDKTSWRYLVALPTADRRGKRTHPRTPTENRIEQIKGALTRLAQKGRVQLRPSGTRNRFEGFQLLNEVADNHRGITYYKTPHAVEPTIEIPVNFFLAGWVHALTDSEIIAYLYLLHHAKLRPDENAGDGMMLTRFAWAEAFGVSRGYEAYRFLERFGLISVIRDERRRADGTIEGLDEVIDQEIEISPHRFKVDLTALERRAVPVVTAALEAFKDGIDLEMATWGMGDEARITRA